MRKLETASGSSSSSPSTRESLAFLFILIFFSSGAWSCGSTSPELVSLLPSSSSGGSISTAFLLFFFSFFSFCFSGSAALELFFSSSSRASFFIIFLSLESDAAVLSTIIDGMITYKFDNTCLCLGVLVDPPTLLSPAGE
uniref:Uncharacterized protein n=1 Tax=Rhizophora mucronata TaxID=61149 RepID=A0A2P2PT98_RHIMU